MNRIFIMVFAALLAVSFTQCKRDVKDYSFEVNIPKTINGLADLDSLVIPVEIAFNGYDMSKTGFTLNFIQIKAKGMLFSGEKQIEEGKEFPITSPKFNLKFYASKEGQYQLKFKFSNSKGFSQEKDVFINFDEADFSFRVDTLEVPHDSTMWQGIENLYRFKIVPVVEEPTGYKIKFNESWVKQIKLDDDTIPVELGKYYDIKDKNNISIRVIKVNADEEKGFSYTIEPNRRNVQVSDTVMCKIKKNIFTIDNVLFAGENIVINEKDCIVFVI